MEVSADPLKALSPIEVTEDGIVILSREEPRFEAKAFAPIVSSPEGKVIDANPERLNAPAPILLTDTGRMIE